MHSKDKGNIGEARVKCDLLEKGYTVLVPEGDNCPFDLVAWDGSNFYRIQVKYRNIHRGCLTVRFESNSYSSKNITKKEIDKDLIDFYAVFCPDTKLCYYFNPKDFNKSISLRVDEPKKSGRASNQYTIKMATDYLNFPPL